MHVYMFIVKPGTCGGGVCIEWLSLWIVLFCDHGAWIIGCFAWSYNHVKIFISHVHVCMKWNVCNAIFTVNMIYNSEVYMYINLSNGCYIRNYLGGIEHQLTSFSMGGGLQSLNFWEWW